VGPAPPGALDGDHAGPGAPAVRGASIARFAHNDLDELETLLRGKWRRPGLICADGINSMTGNPPDLARMAALAREHDVLLYMDDAHGFGVIGERSDSEPCDYGIQGNSIVRHLPPPGCRPQPSSLAHHVATVTPARLPG